MTQSMKTGLAVISTVAIVACSLLVPRQMMVASDQKVDGEVNAAEKDYYTGALEAYAGEDDFHTRMMLLTGKWVSREVKLETLVYDVLDTYGAQESVDLGIHIDGEVSSINVKGLDTIRRLSLDYWDGENNVSRPAFLAQGNVVRTVCNLTAFDLMPELLNLYYESWAFQGANVYRYTDLLLRKYECDAARFQFASKGWDAQAELLVDVVTGDFIGIWVSYDAAMAQEWLRAMELAVGWTVSEDGDEEELKILQEELNRYHRWQNVFLTGEMVTREVLDQDVTEFLERIDFTVENVVTTEEEIAGISRVPHDTVSSETGITYAYIVTENSSKKKFYFVISSSKGSFEAYFSPMTEKISGNNLTEQ